MAGLGSLFGPYQIIELIGEGGIGRVYKSRDTRLQRFVARKVPGENFSDRFIRETKAISKLNHPGICSIFDVAPGHLVMEYIRADHFADQCAGKPPQITPRRFWTRWTSLISRE